MFWRYLGIIDELLGLSRQYNQPPPSMTGQAMTTERDRAAVSAN
jgi:hypothetical protein